LNVRELTLPGLSALNQQKRSSAQLSGGESFAQTVSRYLGSDGTTRGLETPSSLTGSGTSSVSPVSSSTASAVSPFILQPGQTDPLVQNLQGPGSASYTALQNNIIALQAATAPMTVGQLNPANTTNSAIAGTIAEESAALTAAYQTNTTGYVATVPSATTQNGATASTASAAATTTSAFVLQSGQADPLVQNLQGPGSASYTALQNNIMALQAATAPMTVAQLNATNATYDAISGTIAEEAAALTVAYYS
jgi:hypothetical protein